jgi:hypothetical protein
MGYTSLSHAYTRPRQDYAQNKSLEPCLEMKLELKTKRQSLLLGSLMEVHGLPAWRSTTYEHISQHLNTVGAGYDIRTLGPIYVSYTRVWSGEPTSPMLHCFPTCPCAGMPNLIPIDLQIYLRYSE